jgi:hypothetical protein
MWQYYLPEKIGNLPKLLPKVFAILVAGRKKEETGYESIKVG